MALTFPLAAATFADLLFLSQAEFSIDDMQELSGVASGDLQAANLAPARWVVDCKTMPLTFDQSNRVQALINSLGGALRTFYLYPTKGAYPASDPDGSIYGASTPTVDVVTDSYSLSLSGFPAGYVLKAGEFVSITYGTSRVYLGQFAEDGTADGSGDLATITVGPRLPAGVANGDAVSLIKPPGKFKIKPRSAYPSGAGGLHETISFTAIQTHEA